MSYSRELLDTYSGRVDAAKVKASRLRIEGILFRLVHLGHVVEPLKDLITICSDPFRVQRVLPDIFLKNLKCIFASRIRIDAAANRRDLLSRRTALAAFLTCSPPYGSGVTQRRT